MEVDVAESAAGESILLQVLSSYFWLFSCLVRIKAISVHSCSVLSPLNRSSSVPAMHIRALANHRRSSSPIKPIWSSCFGEPKLSRGPCTWYFLHLRRESDQRLEVVSSHRLHCILVVYFGFEQLSKFSFGCCSCR